MKHPLDYSHWPAPGEPDPIGDLMEREGVTFPDAVDKLYQAILTAAADPELAWLDLANTGGRPNG